MSAGGDTAGEERSGIATALARLAVGGSLGRDGARAAMDDILSGRATPAQVGALLMGLCVKGESVEEISGLVAAMRGAAATVRTQRQGVMDLCGTGGDGSGTFNISTAAALAVAGAGVPVAKHGNRSASSLCGSADVLEALGVPIDLDPEAAGRVLDEVGFVFLFAPRFHPAMRHAAGPRRELGVRTVFNLLGPMANPAGVRRQLVGVYADALRGVVVDVLASLGSESVWAVHAEDGLDEVSISAPTRVRVLFVSSGEQHVEERVIAPEDAGLPRHPPGSLRGGGAAENAAIIARVLGAERGPHRDAVVLNAAAALVAHGVVTRLDEAARRAEEALDSGAARRVLDALRTRR